MVGPTDVVQPCGCAAARARYASRLADGREDLVGELRAVLVGDRGGLDAHDDLVGVDLLERDRRFAPDRDGDRFAQEALDLARQDVGRRRARRSTEAGSRSGTTAAERMTLLGTIMESPPWASVV